GGMGVVYLAVDARLGRRVALKVLAPELAEDPVFRERFIAESQRAAAIDHPNIIPIYGAGEVDGLLYIAMRYVEGRDLAGILRREGPLEPRRAIALLSQVANGLDVAHAQGLVHRDVKPANILIPDRPAGQVREHAYLVDFGLTKPVTASPGLTRTGQTIGTVAYMAPEQISGGPLSGRTDQYALGCVLYELVTGLPPYRVENDAALLFAHVSQPAPRLSEHQPQLASLDPVLARAMAKRPDDRYPTLSEFTDAASSALTSPTAEPPMPPRTRDAESPTLVVGPASAAAPPTAAGPRLQASNRPGRRAAVVTVGAMAIVAAVVVSALASGLFAGAPPRGTGTADGTSQATPSVPAAQPSVPAAVSQPPVVTVPPTETVPPIETVPPAESVPPTVAEEVHLTEGLPRTVTFANLEFTVTDAFASNQTVESYAAGTDAEAGEDRFVYLVGTVVNRSTAFIYSNVAVGVQPLAIMLELSDGDQLTPVDASQSISDSLTTTLDPQASVESFLAFPLPDVDATSDLFEGAVLHLGRPPDRMAALPLTGPVPDPEYPKELALGGQVTAPGAVRGQPVTVTIMGGTLSEDVLPHQGPAGVGIRADAGTVFLHLQVRAVTPGPLDENVGHELYRLLVDDVPRAPFEAGLDRVVAGIPADYDVSFVIPEEASDLVLQVGRLGGPTQRIGIDLGSLGG
ncbi:MAG: protein kinase, partial [Chloroflexi bacterium]|nr:protein kinase [Chloroflexota bacterium]